jgi:hypothetical protein
LPDLPVKAQELAARAEDSDDSGAGRDQRRSPRQATAERRRNAPRDPRPVHRATVAMLDHEPPSSNRRAVANEKESSCAPLAWWRFTPARAA